MTFPGREPRITLMPAPRPLRLRLVTPPLLLLGAIVIAIVPARAAPRAAPDPLAAMLADDWSDATRAAVADRVRGLGGAACATLAGYAAAQDPRSREHAVRALDIAGCDTIEDYQPFFADRAPWVVDAVIEAVARRRIAASWPFILAHVDDRRRLVSDDGSWTIEEAAHRSLRRLTGQPIPFATDDSPEARDRAAAAWVAWFAAHAGESPSAWLESGLAAARAALAGSDPVRRMAALETLALSDGRGLALLRDALLRAPGEIEARLVCTPEEPPRVTETVPCALVLRNAAARRIPLALGDAGIALAGMAGPPADLDGKEPRRDGKGSGGARGKRSAAPPPAVAPPPPPPATAADLRGRFVDLAPGASTTLPLNAGPVATAGRYEARATVRDLGVALPGPAGGRPDQIEAATIVRFEQ
jgi:hypothetical protein